jgi:hypothetical protein
MQLPAKFGIGLIGFGASAISSALSFLVIASVWVVRADPSGSGSGYAIVFFFFVAPVIGVLAAILITVSILIMVRLLPANIRPNPELPLPALQAILLSLASLFIGFFLTAISTIVFLGSGN